MYPKAMLFVFILIALTADAFSSTGAVVNDWPHPRGPRFDGVFADAPIATKWPTNGLTAIWDRPIGHGFSGMTVKNGRVYTQAQTLGGQELICLSLDTGEVLWKSRYAFPWEMDGNYPGPFGTPVTHEDRIFFTDPFGTILCANARNGSIEWKFNAVPQLSPAGVDFGYAPTPLIFEGRVIAPAPAGDSKTTIYSLDAFTGKLVWSAGTNFPSYASCLPINVQGQTQIVLFLRNGIAGYHPNTGAELWRDTWTKGYDEHSSWPLYQEPFLFCSSPFRRGSRLYRLSMQKDQAPAELVWENKLLSNDIFSSALHNGYVYGYDVRSQQSELLGRTRGSLRCLELATGKAMWTNEAIAHCSVSLMGNRLLLLEDEGGLILIEANPETYRELARTQLPKRGKYWTAPVILGDNLLVRSRETIACYNLGASKPAQTTSAAKAEHSDLLMEWFQKHRSYDFTAPGTRVLAKWFTHGLALTLIAWGLGLAAPEIYRAQTILSLAFGLGIAGTYWLTMLRGQFIFTVPVSLCAAFCGLLVFGMKSPKWRGWLMVLGFAAACAGYYFFCAQFNLLAGWGFLTGFPFALWPGLWFAKSNGRNPAPFALTFTAYFWGAALVILWRTS